MSAGVFTGGGVTAHEFSSCLCGSFDISHSQYPYQKNREHQIECEDCGKKTGFKKNLSDAVKEWNRMNAK